MTRLYHNRSAAYSFAAMTERTGNMRTDGRNRFPEGKRRIQQSFCSEKQKIFHEIVREKAKWEREVCKILHRISFCLPRREGGAHGGQQEIFCVSRIRAAPWNEEEHPVRMLLVSQEEKEARVSLACWIAAITLSLAGPPGSFRSETQVSREQAS